MKNLKTIFATVSLIMCMTFVNAQKKTIEGKATEKIELMNEQIISIDESLALNATQKKELIAIQVLKLKAVKEIKNSEISDEEIKAKSKEVYKNSYKKMAKIISKEQKDAYKSGKNKL
jgi:hypothetical protein